MPRRARHWLRRGRTPRVFGPSLANRIWGGRGLPSCVYRKPHLATISVFAGKIPCPALEFQFKILRERFITVDDRAGPPLARPCGKSSNIRADVDGHWRLVRIRNVVFTIKNLADV